MNLWQFLDKQLERLERNSLGCAIFTIILLTFLMPLLMALTRRVVGE